MILYIRHIVHFLCDWVHLKTLIDVFLYLVVVEISSCEGLCAESAGVNDLGAGAFNLTCGCGVHCEELGDCCDDHQAVCIGAVCSFFDPIKPLCLQRYSLLGAVVWWGPIKLDLK